MMRNNHPNRRRLSVPPGQMVNPAVTFAVKVMFASYTGPRHFADDDARTLKNMAALRGFDLFVPIGTKHASTGL